MPVDKWGIPFWYPTKTSAGQTGSGNGFFWQQNNNFREDEDDGMLRLGKETDDCKLINSSTGEWEFPYLSDGDGISISGGTGHHTGGVSHGCQGFAYMIDNTWDTNPVKWRFRKEMYHVNYDDHPSGTFTHAKSNFQIAGHGWVGEGWVRYNKKDGRGPGKDSVIMELWWNPHPDTDIKDWTMLKRIEDKGGWGSGGSSCGGEDDQVGTWSAIQWRFKSSSSDFSLHPIRPETNEGENIHCIGEEDMDFSRTEDRGYCLQANIPRDIEMKCLYKKDSPSDGKCRFKNISLREIDPTKSFDDDPNTPPIDGGGGGGEVVTSTIQGTFRFNQDINILRTSECAGTGTGSTPTEPGGGAPEETGSAMFYQVTSTDSTTELSNTATFQNRTRGGEQCANSSSAMRNKEIHQFDVWLRKVGSPAATPHIFAKIWSSGGSTIYTSPTEIDPSTLTTSFVKKTFSFSANTHAIQTGDVIGVNYDTSSTTDYVEFAYGDDIIPNCTYVNYESGVWEPKPTTRDFSCQMWT